MKLIICTDVQRDNNKPLYTISVYDVERPVNFHSYECYYYKQGRDYDALVKEAHEVIDKEYIRSSDEYKHGEFGLNPETD